MIRGIWWETDDEMIVCLSSTESRQNLSLLIGIVGNSFNRTVVELISPESVTVIRFPMPETEVPAGIHYLLVTDEEDEKKFILKRGDEKTQQLFVSLYSAESGLKGDGDSGFFSAANNFLGEVVKRTINEFLGIIHSL